MKKKIIIAVAVIVILAAGGTFYLNHKVSSAVKDGKIIKGFHVREFLLVE